MAMKTYFRKQAGGQRLTPAGLEFRQRVGQTLRFVAPRAAVAVVLVLLIMAGYSQAWTGFGEYLDAQGNFHPAKMLWDWIALLVVPIVLGLGAFWFNRSERETKEAIAGDQLREEALQSYLDRMAELLLTAGLRASEEGSEVREVARARTLTVLRRLDRSRKEILLNFLYESELIQATAGDEGGAAISLRGADLRSIRLRGAYLSGIDLREADLSGADLSGAELHRADLSEATLSGADLSNATLREARLVKAALNEANLSRADLGEADLSGADLRGANLIEADMSEAYLAGAYLSDARLNRADLHQSNLFEADLGAARLIRANLHEADLREANLHKADLRGGVDLRQANLKGTNLHAARLHKANLAGANLRGANLRAAKLTVANLNGADLEWADLRQADLSSATMKETNLSRANLAGAVLHRADRQALITSELLAQSHPPEGPKQ
jgi:uncharacterized protein YjbI with pentapeptide repeats